MNEIIENILVKRNLLRINNDHIKIINAKACKNSKFKPICKETVAYIVAVILINESNQVCLIQEAKKSCMGKYYMPAGRMESGETLTEAAIREAKEETGYLIEPLMISTIEIDELALWFRITFIARIVGGKLKTLKEADTESLQANWFSIDELNLQSTFSILRSLDFLKLVDISLNYYKKYNINSFSSTLSTHGGLNLFVKPLNNSHSNILFTFVLISQDLKSYISYNKEKDGDKDNSTGLGALPSVMMIPDIYLNNKQHCFDYTIQSILFPECFKFPKEISYKSRGVASIEHNGQYDENARAKDGIQFLFLLSLFKQKNFNNNEDNTIQTKSDYKWNPIPSDFATENVAKNLEPFQFVTLLLNY
jgi:ADP-ribose pyrophosphatase YjhB (NUDIX family)